MNDIAVESSLLHFRGCLTLNLGTFIGQDVWPTIGHVRASQMFQYQSNCWTLSCGSGPFLYWCWPDFHNTGQHHFLFTLSYNFLYHGQCHKNVPTSKHFETLTLVTKFASSTSRHSRVSAAYRKTILKLYEHHHVELIPFRCINVANLSRVNT